MVNHTALKKELNKQELGSFYKTVGGAEGDKCFYPTRLDTYGKGCFYDCKYRYAKQLLDFRKMWNPNSPATPDIKEIKKVINNIPTTDNEILKKTDNAKSFEVRKKVVETLYNHDFDVSVRLAPFLYNTTDFDKINEIQSEKCLVEFLRINNNAKKGLKGIVNFNEYTVTEGGCKHLPLDKKLQIINKLDFPRISVCDDVQEHYEYFLKNVCANPNDCCDLTLW